MNNDLVSDGVESLVAQSYSVGLVLVTGQIGAVSVSYSTASEFFV